MGDTRAVLCHLTTLEAWDSGRRAGAYVTDSLDVEGFIHLSRGEQLLLAANTHYRGRTDLVVLIIDEGRLEPGRLVDEAGSAPNQHLIFPHLYGALSPDAVTAIVPFPCGPDGSFDWPTGLGPTA